MGYGTDPGSIGPGSTSRPTCVAVFETGPSPQPLEIIGRVVIELAATADVPDFISERKLVRPGQTVRLRMNNLVTANRFQRRHRLRVIIIPQFSPLFSVNPQTGSLEFDTNSVRAGEIRIAHSADQPSRIVPPVVPVD